MILWTASEGDKKITLSSENDEIVFSIKDGPFSTLGDIVVSKDNLCGLVSGIMTIFKIDFYRSSDGG